MENFVDHFSAITELKTDGGLTVGVYFRPDAYENLYVKVIDGPNGWVDLFKTESTGPSDMDLAIQVMNAGFMAAEEAELASA